MNNSQWIPTSEKLPPKWALVPVLVRDVAHPEGPGSLFKDMAHYGLGGWIFLDRSKEGADRIEYWCELPPLPAKEEVSRG